MNELKLYCLPTCYFCHKVLHFMEKNNILIETHLTSQPDNRDFLITHGGKNQVPCLFIGKEPLYESDDIIAYLKERFINEGA